MAFKSAVIERAPVPSLDTIRCTRLSNALPPRALACGQLATLSTLTAWRHGAGLTIVQVQVQERP